MRTIALVALSLLALGDAANQKRTVVVTGATGRTGSLIYKRLVVDGGYHVRALVRNSTKAKTILGCKACDESDGIFVGDITDSKSLEGVMKNADVLAIATSSVPVCTGIAPFPPLGKCTYHKGAEPVKIDFEGTKTQVKAFGAGGKNLASKQILYVSTMETTRPNNILDSLADGHVSFYHLQAEVNIMSAGIPYTIAKACGLGDKAAGKNKIIVGHDDASFSLILDHVIQRDDVARILFEAIRNPSASAGLRFDVCSQYLGSPTTDDQIVDDVFKAARLPWQKVAKTPTSIQV